MKKQATKLFASVMCIAVLVISTVLPSFSANSKDKSWAAAWTAGMSDISVNAFKGMENVDGVKLSPFIKDMTVRIRITPTMDGEQVRFTLSNRYGTAPLKIDKAFIGVADGESGNTIKGKNHAVTFNGEEAVTIPAGKEMTCDPVKMDVHAFEDLCVTYYAENFGQVQTISLYNGSTTITVGDRTGDKTLRGISLNISSLKLCPLLSEVDVFAEDASTIVVIGDSTVSNDISLILAKRIAKETGRNNIGVVAQGIMGDTLVLEDNGIVSGIYGEPVIERYSRDALNIPGCRYTLVKIGANDIIHPRCESMADRLPIVSVDELIDGFKNIIKQANDAGVKIVISELSPWKGYTRDLTNSGKPDVEWCEEYQKEFDKLNEWIRTQKLSDGYINVDALKDKDDVFKMPDDYTKDGVHLTLVAQQAFVDSLDLSLFGIGKNTPEQTNPAESTTSNGTTDSGKNDVSQKDDATSSVKNPTNGGNHFSVNIPDTGASISAAVGVLAVACVCAVVITKKRK